MSKASSDEIVLEMEHLRGMFRNCRAYFPFVSEANLGQQVIETAPYYINAGYRLVIIFDRPLDMESIQRINELIIWENQNFVIRLYALLNARGVVSDKKSINQILPGWYDIDLIRRLRNPLAHSSGRYNKNNSVHRKLRADIIKHLNLSNPLDGFPLAIDTVLDRLFDGCLKYVRARAEQPVQPEATPNSDH